MRKGRKTLNIHRTSVSLRMDHREKLQDVKNISAVINYALDCYFSKIKYMRESEMQRRNEAGGKDFLSSADQLNDITYMDGRDFSKSEIRKWQKSNVYDKKDA